jgi:dolichol-phosphate mannosyltransferase
MSARPADLAVVLPTYNERDRLAELVDAVFNACRAAHVELELIIVDDNSPDGTGALADELARSRNITVVHRAGKLGLGTAVVAGFDRASAPIVGVMDADFSHPPSLVPALFKTARALNADLVVASRYIPGGSTPGWPRSRRVLSRIGGLLAWPLTSLRDPTSGCFVIRRDIVQHTTIKAGGFKICLELLVRGWPLRIVEVPFSFVDRELGESKMSRGEATRYLVQLKDLIWFRLSGPRRPAQQYQRLTEAELADISQTGR